MLSSIKKSKVKKDGENNENQLETEADQ